MKKVFYIIAACLIVLYVCLTIADKIRCSNIDKKRNLENDNTL